jgi:prepilin signal peptidase PulO-like enzyme (type II secretory pathway)
MLIVVFICILAISIGSLASFIGHRIFSEKHFILAMRSVCSSCDKPLPMRSLVPIFSYFVQKCRCLMCGKLIHPKYIMLEVISLAAFLAIYWRFEYGVVAVFLYILTALSLVHIATDLEYYMASDTVSLLSFICSISLGFYVGISIKQMIMSFALVLLFFIALRTIMYVVLKKDPLGMGDIKIIASLSVLVGSLQDFSNILLICGILGVIFGKLWSKITHSEAFPFAPPLVVGFMVNFIFYNDYLKYVL